MVNRDVVYISSSQRDNYIKGLLKEFIWNITTQSKISTDVTTTDVRSIIDTISVGIVLLNTSSMDDVDDNIRASTLDNAEVLLETPYINRELEVDIIALNDSSSSILNKVKNINQNVINFESLTDVAVYLESLVHILEYKYKVFDYITFRDDISEIIDDYSVQIYESL